MGNLLAKSGLITLLIGLVTALSFVGCGGGGSSSGSSGSGATTRSISGVVTGTVISGVTVSVKGTKSGTTTTNALGEYTISGLVNGYYLVTAGKTGSKFAPFGQVACINDASVTDRNFTESSAGTLYSVSGSITATGVSVANCVVTISGTNGAGQVLTDASGNYVFTGIPNGSYTVIPTKVGHDFVPTDDPATVSGSDSPSHDFNENIRTLSVSGTITYAGSESGRIYIRLMHSEGSSTEFGTSISPTGAYTIRGSSLEDGNYYVQAFMDTLGYGIENTAAPSGTSTAIVISPGPVTNVTGKNITLIDPVSAGAVVSPTGLTVMPGDGCAMAFWDVTENISSTETAQSYNLYWSTLPGVSKTVTIGGGAALNIPAHDDGHFLHRGLSNTVPLYYVVTANIGGTESAESETFSTTIGAPIGGATITGTVTFPSTSGILYIGLYSETGVFITSTNVATAVTSQAYALPGVTSGTYQAFAIFDLDNNGHITLGDMTNTNDMTNSITITTTDKTVNQTLSNANAGFRITVNHSFEGIGEEHYGLEFRVNEGMKRPVKVTVNSGPFVTGPVDLAKEWSFEYEFQFEHIKPSVGDTYQVTVTYSDGSSQNLSIGVTIVMDNFAQTLATTSSLTPTLSWTAPAVEPDFYTYNVRVENVTGNEMWDYPKDSNMPSSQLSVVYNVDGNALPLSSATTYRLVVIVMDANGNKASFGKDFITP